MFGSILIANRGEIARRVMRTARRMGLRTIAVYSDADRDALHVREADAAVHIGGAAAKDSYLRIDAILAAAKATGAEAVHPGYGFLSEKPDFARACVEAGLIFVGPPASAIEAMGLKDAAKAIVAKAGVPVVPGYQGDDQSAERLRAEAGRTGYPVLIKAVAGGGGKGMRRVESDGEFVKALEGAKREAAAAFGDDRVLIEKYVARPRHIEIQIFGDLHGNAVHLFERDCSLQRRHQKVVEEAPAPGMTEAIRNAMGEAAVAAAKAIGYAGAGTVEFIVDSSRGLRSDGFYFMEMNTRLQVEHPVTEMVTGLDLVELQLRVAAGEALPPQEAFGLNGHAIEARLYAEDPAKGFLPSIGPLRKLALPIEAEGLRVDSGVREGDAVTMHYDPMIAKIVAHGRTRDEARLKLARAMEETEVFGVKTNAAFVARCLRQAGFASGDVDTGFIDRHMADLSPGRGAPPPEALAIAALGALLAAKPAPGGWSGDPWSVADGFRLGGGGFDIIEFEGEGGPVAVTLRRTGDGFVAEASNALVHLRGAIEGERLRVEFEQAGVRRSESLHFAARGRDVDLLLDGETYAFRVHDPSEVDDLAADAGSAIVAPMPGKIVAVSAKAGDKVRRGAALVALEAMKMEHTLVAHADRTVAEVLVAPGDQVAEGAVVIRFED